MPVATKPQPAPKVAAEPRPVLGPTGNRVRASPEEPKRKNASLTKPRQVTKPGPELPASAVQNNVSVDTVCSSDSTSSGGSSKKVAKLSRTTKRVGAKPTKLARNPPRADAGEATSKPSGPLKRCDWITPNSDPVYVSFHDEEWGAPVHDDWKLFELLVFSQALAELSWPTILRKRDTFRKHFDNFDASLVAQYDEKKLLSMKVHGSLLLSEAKLRAILENAKEIVKIQKEFGSFNNYCWSFVNHKPIRNGFRYARQIPVKTPKAEVMSKNMMQRGFCCVGPTVVYSFMQVAGIVNDHVLCCFRFHECGAAIEKDLKPKNQEPEKQDGASE
ncbi:hypothetical protein CDL15_Pgr004003 [Punica granatum]|uniref:Uncharacterized protein n=1 Tax=Punica granatum TaxID=22663 RepID=A0A218WQ67_PUNGR|nr:hypothetical protein CDL15_Pgr004003 [Punica granatum]